MGFPHGISNRNDLLKTCKPLKATLQDDDTKQIPSKENTAVLVKPLTIVPKQNAFTHPMNKGKSFGLKSLTSAIPSLAITIISLPKM
jgi:hypothetical protein